MDELLQKSLIKKAVKNSLKKNHNLKKAFFKKKNKTIVNFKNKKNE